MTDHLSPEELLLYLDGELPKRRQRAVEPHIRSCWSCATELERLKEDIGLIVDAQNDMLGHCIPPPPSPWRPVEALQAVAGKKRRFRWFTWAFLRPPAWLTSALAGAALLVMASVWLSAPRASAKAMLRGILNKEEPRMALTPGKFLHQRVHVVRKQRHTGQTVSGLVDSWRSADRSYWRIANGDAAALALEAYYRERNLMELPLAPQAYDAWAQDTKNEGWLSETGGTVELDFAANGAGNLEKLRLFADRNAWHVTRMDLDFGDDDFDISELDWAVISRADVPPEVIARLEPKPRNWNLRIRREKSSSAATERAAAIRPPAAERESAGIDVYFALHQAGADLGEPVDVTPLLSGRNVVRIWGVPAERREFLIRLLEGIPGVDVQSEPLVNQAAASQLVPLQPSTAADAAPSRRHLADEDRLLHWFGNAQVQEGFTRSVLANANALLAHLFALKKLAARWPTTEVPALTEGSKAKLAIMVGDHARTAELRCSDLRILLTPLLNDLSPQGEGAVSKASTTLDWQSAAAASLDSAKSLDRFLRGILTTNDLPMPLDSTLPQVRVSLESTASEINLLLSTK